MSSPEFAAANGAHAKRAVVKAAVVKAVPEGKVLTDKWLGQMTTEAMHEAGAAGSEQSPSSSSSQLPPPNKKKKRATKVLQLSDIDADKQVCFFFS